MSVLASRRTKIIAIIAFLAISVAILNVQTTPVPESSWINIFKYYPVFWLGLFVATVSTGMIAREQPNSVLPFGLIILIGLAAVSVTFIWGVPFGPRDPWIHIDRIANHRFSLNQNSYPASHIIGALLVELLNISPIALTMRAAALITAVGIIMTFLFVQSYATTYQATIALIAALPAVVFFRSRPFSLAWALLPLALFAIIQSSTSNNDYYRHLLVAIPIISALLIIHPFVFFILTIITLIGVILAITSIRFDLEITFMLSNWTLRSLSTWLLIIGTLLSAYLFVISDIGSEAVVGAIISIFETAPSEAGGSTGRGQIELLLSGGAYLIQGLIRMGHSILLGLLATLAVYSQFRHQRPQFHSLLMYTSAIVIGMTMVAFTFVGIERVGLTRIFLIAPLLLGLCIAPICERTRGKLTVSNIIVSLLLVSAVIMGGLVQYDTGFTGNVEISSNQKHVSSIDHLEEYRGKAPVVGGRISFWVIEGRIGNKAVYEWTPTGESGKYLTSARPIEYAWFVSDAPDDTLYIVEGVDKQLSESRTQQYTTNDHACMTEFVETNNIVYTNGQDEIAMHASSGGATCV